MKNFNCIIKIVPKKNMSRLSNLDPSESNAPFRIINIGSNKPIKLLTCIKLIEKIIGKTAIKKFMSAQKGDIIKTHSDIGKIKKVFKYKSKIGIREGLTNFIAWFKIYYKLN